MTDIISLARKNIRELAPYSSARDEYSGEEGIFLDANENSFGTLEPETLNRYPDPYQEDLKSKLAEIYNINIKNLFLGNGSDEAIDLMMRAFCEPQQDNILLLPPTYGMYRVAANINNINIKEAPLNPDFTINMQKVQDKIDKNTKLIYLCSPNNPTANLFDPEKIKKILTKFNGLLIVDEAYVDFTDKQNMIEELPSYDNLVVFRTFSKAWGMANIRLGMAFADQRVIELLNKIKYPYNVNGLTARKALDLIDQREVKQDIVESILQQREILRDELEKISGVKKVYPSEANFLLVEFEKALELFEYLKEKDIIIRNRTQELHCDNCLRITVGKPKQNQQVIQEVKKFYKSLKS